MGNYQVRFCRRAGGVTDRLSLTARSVEYKTSGWKLLDPKHVRFTDKNGIGDLKLVGTYDLAFYSKEQIKRVRIVRRADGYYVQFAIAVERSEPQEPAGTLVGLDVGLESFYTDRNGNKATNPRFLRKGTAKLRRLQRRLSRKQKGSGNRCKARKRLAKEHLKLSRQRKDHAVKLARCVVQSNDLVAYESLQIRNMQRNHCLAKSISDAGWYQFRMWIDYYAEVFGRIAVAVPPQYTSQKCSACGNTVKKSLSSRTHICKCGCRLDRDENAARNILATALRQVGWGNPNFWMWKITRLLGRGSGTFNRIRPRTLLEISTTGGLSARAPAWGRGFKASTTQLAHGQA